MTVSPLSTAPELRSLKKRREFVALTKSGRRVFLPALSLQAAPTPRADESGGGIRFGLTVSRRNGNAVSRNRIRRRLRALAREVLPLRGKIGFDYVLVARPECLRHPWARLRQELRGGLGRLHSDSAGKRGKQRKRGGGRGRA